MAIYGRTGGNLQIDFIVVIVVRFLIDIPMLNNELYFRLKTRPDNYITGVTM
jgi:hypothetical protein